MLKHELGDFYVQYQSLIQTYNAEATKLNARGQRADLATLMTQRDQLVQSFVTEIQANISPGGWTKFQSFAQAEKVHMKISSPVPAVSSGVQQ